jgi:hypothetical protein
MESAHHYEDVRVRLAQRTRRSFMYARVVRFTDVDPDHLAGRLAELENGPPADIAVSELQILHDEDQRTAVVIQLFETADDMAAAEGALDAMDPAETPGTRASIDRCEIVVEVSPARRPSS